MNLLLKTIFAAFLGAVACSVSAAPHHFDTLDHVCVETRWDPYNHLEYCSVYEARRTRRPYHPTHIIQHHRPVYYRTYRPGVSVNIRSRSYDFHYRVEPEPHQVHHHGRYHRNHHQ